MEQFQAFISSLITPRDFLFAGVPMIATYIMESINESIIPIFESGNSAIVAGSIGLIVNKSIVEYIYQYREKQFTLESAKKYIELLEEDIQNEDDKNVEKEYIIIKQHSVKTLLKFYKEKVYTYKEFKNQFDKIKMDKDIG